MHVNGKILEYTIQDRTISMLGGSIPLSTIDCTMYMTAKKYHKESASGSSNTSLSLLQLHDTNFVKH